MVFSGWLSGFVAGRVGIRKVGGAGERRIGGGRAKRRANWAGSLRDVSAAVEVCEARVLLSAVTGGTGDSRHQCVALALPVFLWSEFVGRTRRFEVMRYHLRHWQSECHTCTA